jgi:Domain of Unknown Function (DUF1206)
VDQAFLFADIQPGHGARALGETRLGTVLFVVVALGFAAYGVYCHADAATRRAC